MKKNKNNTFIRKSKNTAVRILFGRSGLILLFSILQLLFFIVSFLAFSEKSTYFWMASFSFSIIMFGIMINADIDSSAKLTWTVVILLLPIFGGALFFFTKSDVGHRRLKNQYAKEIQKNKGQLKTDPELESLLKETNPEIYALGNYLQKSGCHPIYQNTDLYYYPSGEAMWKGILEALQKAKEFIFLEFFIIEKGEMWDSILKILTEKASEGIDVRLMYDGTCEFALLPHSYPKVLKKAGIKVQVFSSIKPFISTRYNYRDHRKILVIDGKVGFVGGVNLADEYINRVNRFGHWKDAAIKLEGEAVKSLTLFFLEMWNLGKNTEDYTSFLSGSSPIRSAKGMVIPYCDCPLDEYKVGRAVYLDILNRAKTYVHIMTPYLILDGELECALRFAAERGVEVILILPGKPDKKIPYALATTHYTPLLRSGVRIFEYSPGFMHAKVFISDDIKAVCGSINLDYRSLYHHFESAVYLYGSDCIDEMEKDFQNTLSLSKEVTLKDNKHQKLCYKLIGNLFKIFAPLM